RRRHGQPRGRVAPPASSQPAAAYAAAAADRPRCRCDRPGGDVSSGGEEGVSGLTLRHPRIAKRVAGISEASEEILASLLGAMIGDGDADRVTLFAKATGELLDNGQSVESATRQLQQLGDVLEALI